MASFFRRQALYAAWFVSYFILTLSVIGLYVQGRQDAREARIALAEKTRLNDQKIKAESDRINHALCEKQNELREQIRNFVLEVSDDPETRKRVRVAFADISCKDIIDSERGEQD